MNRITSFFLLSLLALGILLVGLWRYRLNSGTISTVTTFEQQVIDLDMAGDVKLVGDIDSDGFLDLVVGGKPGENLQWYHYPNWLKTQIAVPDTEFTTDGDLGDIDGDGDLDVVVPDGDENDNLKWFENPLSAGDPFKGTNWTRHTVGSIGSWGKDVELADFDDNGQLDVATRSKTTLMIFFQTAPNSWHKVAFNGLTIGSEGLARGDIDQDGDIDLVLRGTWLRNPGGANAQNPTAWSEHSIGSTDANFKALVVDLNQDGKMDVLFSSSEDTATVQWWTPTTNDPTGSWASQTIVSSLNRAHTLQAADMDSDGDTDVVLAQMHTSKAKEVMVYLNLDGKATSWQKEVVATTGLHNGVVADIDNDGDYDIFGSNWTGNPPLHLWENKFNPMLDRWTYIQVDDSRPNKAFGLAMGDITGDGYEDIVSGGFFYRNPGGDMTGTWARIAFPTSLDAMLIVDIDGDAQADIIGESLPDVYWLEAQDEAGNSWRSTKIGALPKTGHTNGQGYVLAQVIAGGRPEILLAAGNDDNEIYYFEIPLNPEGGNWPRTRITGEATDEGIGVGDVDGDGDIDIAAGDMHTGGQYIAWFENPGDGSGDWTKHRLGTFDGVWPDRVYLADLNGDAYLDVVVSEENKGTDANAKVYWYEHPPQNPKNAEWPRHIITTQYTTNSMDVADMDFDGDMDIITGEHRGAEKIAIWENINNGASWVEHIVDTGQESHLGARIVDLDEDGDLDIVSIAWDDYQYLHLWRNDAKSP